MAGFKACHFSLNGFASGEVNAAGCYSFRYDQVLLLNKEACLKRQAFKTNLYDETHNEH